jgi:putative membrane protein
MKHFSTIAAAAAATALLLGPAAAFAQAPSDAQIADIVLVADQVDIDAGRLAESRGHSADVRSFGKEMVTDHSAVNQQATDLAKKLNLTPEPSATSKSLSAGGAANLKDLRRLHGAAFDKAYVDHEVAYHQQVIDAIKSTLIPNAQNAQLKQLLQSGLPLFEGHLEHAQQIQSKLGQ